MTEVEAKQKWCPFARVVRPGEYDGDQQPAGWNRFQNEQGNPPVGSCCIGSDCMAWQKTFSETEGRCRMMPA